MSREDLHFRLRIPAGLKSEIEASAAANRRSMTAEIVARLSGTQANLRDQIAIAAMNGFIASMANPDSGGANNHYSSDVAEYAYSIADAMLKAREGGA